MKRTRLIELTAVILFFTLGALVFTYPLVTRVGDHLVGQLGDNIYFVWMIGWFKKAIFTLGVDPLNIWFLNYPEGWNLAYTEITPAMLALAMPFALAGGPTLGYNLAMLLSFVLSGLGMYLWVRDLTGNPAAALLAGTAFAFIPFRVAHFLIGHLNLVGTMWFPFYFWGFFRLLKKNEHFDTRAAILTGVMLGLIGLTSQYYLFMTVIISVFLVLIYLFFIERSAWRDRRFWLQGVLAGAVALPLVLLAVAPYVALNRQGGLPDRDLGSLRQFAASANPTDYLLPATDHFLFGRWVGETFSRDFWIEQSLTIGWVVMALGVFAWFARGDNRLRHLLILMLTGGAFALILSFGLDLHWNEQRVLLPVPTFLQGWVGAAETPIPMPGILMFKFVPFYAKLRAFSRFGIFVLVFSCAAAGIGAAELLSRFKPRWHIPLTAGLILLVLFEFYPGPYRQFSPVQPRPVDIWLSQQAGDGAVIQFPFRMGEDQEQIFNTLIHGRPYVGGFFNAFPPPQYQSLIPIMDHFPDERSCTILPGLGVKFVLLHTPAYEDLSWVRAESERCGLVFIDQIGDEMVFRLEP